MKVLKSFKNHKSYGVDGIKVEFIKWVPKEIV